MYLPLGPALLRFIQLPALLSDYGLSTSRSLVHDDHFKHDRAREALINLGNLSPYHNAPDMLGISQDLPADCTVDQVILLHRHGSRGPEGEQVFIKQLVDTLDNAWDIIQRTELPSNLQFLKEGYQYDLDPRELTVVGRKELFQHGIEFARRYPTFWTDIQVSTTVQRVIDSSHSFAKGFFGLDVDEVDFLTTNNFSDPISWLYPWDMEYCPNMAKVYNETSQTAGLWAEKYVPPITERLNKLIPGVGFTLNDIRGALYACPYDLASRVWSPWCQVFTAQELRDFEYELDLLLDGISGHASRDDPGPLLGAIYVQKLIERLTDERGDAEPLYLEFAHDMTILLALSTMGLNKDPLPLSPTHISPHRKFRSSNQTPFAAEMVWEKFTCQESFQGPQVRLLLNKETFPLSICERSRKDKKYGTCSLDEFVLANEDALRVEYHSAAWNATCGT